MHIITSYPNIIIYLIKSLTSLLLQHKCNEYIFKLFVSSKNITKETLQSCPYSHQELRVNYKHTHTQLGGEGKGKGDRERLYQIGLC